MEHSRGKVEESGLDYGYGQREELTKRLHNLLNDSYTDGFSVPKELIQNADDAGATEVCFMLDERENRDARSDLLGHNMASLQGPALWTYNDAPFKDEDFENIARLGAGTKEEDSSKVGRFGLGFNSVYNLTDVPIFISRHTMGMFDPHAKYLPKGAGLKLDFRRPVDREELTKRPNQFMPFQGVFGCQLRKRDQGDEDVFFEGTLFRFPLRTDEQAKESRIKSESYSESKRREFLRMLMDRAGSLLMFTQSVKKVQVYHLPSDSTDPGTAARLLTATRTSECVDLLTSSGSLCGTLLQGCTTSWFTDKDVKILEQVTIVVDVTDEAKSVCDVDKCRVQTRWKHAWATGIDDSATAAERQGRKGFVPLATVAVLVAEDSIQAVSDSPFGFYRTGHLFCFMPLPQEMVQMNLPVHVNGTFDLTSSRRSLQVLTEDDMRGTGSEWNAALFGDAVCRAYLTLLENVQAEAAKDKDYQRYYGLWPDSGQESLDQHFYRRLVSDNNKVFPVPVRNKWVAFQDAWFLDADFRESECGQLAWHAMNHFWDREGGLVDIPTYICRLIHRIGQGEAFQEKVITKEEFYEKFFFPNIDSDYWKSSVRDKLVHYALMQDNEEILDLVRTHACIPCEGTGKLEYPRRLLHPSKQASKLYRASEGRFPQGAESQKNADQVNFCQQEDLERLERLGMIVDDLPMDMVLERAESASTLLNEDENAALQRACDLLDYLCSVTDCKFRFDSYSPEDRQRLSRIAWLPVLRKPEDWPFPWCGDESSLLAAPGDLYSDGLQNLVACGAKLLNSKAVGGSKSGFFRQKKFVLQALGVTIDEKDVKIHDIVVKQLFAVAEHQKRDPTVKEEKLHQVCHATYAFLHKRLSHHENTCTDLKQLSGADVIWMDNQFVPASRVAFSCVYNCQPYLYQLEGSLQRYRAFFKAIGVKEKFNEQDAVSVLRDIKDSHGEIELDEDTVLLVSRVAQLLCEARKSSEKGEMCDGDGEDIFLPDRHGNMTSTKNLCLDDCPWLQESASMRFVHDTVSTESARALGVQTKRGKDSDELMKPIPFGQHEKLTKRIQRLLEGYTFDSSLFKELLQNADDAGATEIRFILDMRSLGTELVPEGWSEHLQGPALCVYNNKSFTKKDMEGIQNLGEGSKGEDLLKTGQYGVGFNAVYHVTDAPSFWTLQDEKQEVICAFDPNCHYVQKTMPFEPGVKLENVERVRLAYPDMFAGYLEQFIDMSQPGTMFRFPLRTQAMADVSALKQPPVTVEQIEKLLQEFRKEAKSCLLFLNNLQKIGVYHVSSDDGNLTLKYEAERNIIFGNHEEFKDKLRDASRTTDDAKAGLQGIVEDETVLHMTLRDSDFEEKWLTVNRVGFADADSVSEQLLKEWKQKHFRLLPRGGVAVRLSQNKKLRVSQNQSCEPHRAFCTLPLPLVTGLPMHVNGQFVLDHETRRNLWENMEDIKTQWNTAIAQQVIVPAFVRAIQEVKLAWFTDETDPAEASGLMDKLTSYHKLFPELDKAPSTFWKRLMKGVYRRIAHEECPVFPVTHVDQVGVEWAPAVNKSGFPGYFNGLLRFFLDSPASGPVVLSHGGTSQACTFKKDAMSAARTAEDLGVLLKKVNMKILHTPFRVYGEFKHSGVEDVQEVTPATVVQFLKSAGSSHCNGCSIRDLPKPVNDTPLEKVSNVKLLVQFLKKDSAFRDQLDALPLSLRQSGNLYSFTTELDDKKPIVSRFSNLLSESADLFLHEDIFQYFEPVSKTMQTFLQALDIPTFARLLSDTLPISEYRTGQPVSLTENTKPWVKQLWGFLQEQLERKSKPNADVETIRKETENAIQCLSEWSLVPVRRSTVTSEESLLYPVANMHLVVYLSTDTDQANPLMWQILQQLPLPFLDTQDLPVHSVATSMVASISHPMALLRALTSCMGTLSSVAKHGHDILRYFNNSLPLLKKSCSDERELQVLLKNLPFFTAVDDSLTSVSDSVHTLCLCSTLPKQGLMVWARERSNPLLLLHGDCVPENLRQVLGLELPSQAQFYHSYLLPTFNALPSEAILEHVSHIRSYLDTFDDHEKSRLIERLKTTAFIEVNGQRRTAGVFYSPHEPVFQIMCPELFPPKPFCEQEWHTFMKKAGYVHEVVSDLFVRFARQLEIDGQAGITGDVRNKSHILVQHLLHRKDHDKTNLLSRVKDIRFVCSSDWYCTQEGQLLAKVAKPFCTNRLVSFTESSREEHCHLVWSSSCMLHPSADPWRTNFDSRAAENACLNQLEFREYAAKEKVILHAQNVCLALHGREGQEIFRSLEVESKNLLLRVMESLYGFLETEVRNRELSQLKGLPIICDIEKKQMLSPDRVVIDLRDDEAIAGHIQKAPIEFGKFFDFFTRLGVAEYVTADHYADVLTRLSNSAAGSSVMVTELQTVSKAIEGLFRCLRSKIEGQRKLTTSALYLPAENTQLLRTTDLTFIDDPRLRDRFKELCTDLQFFLGFEKLEIKFRSPLNEVKRLPENYQMKMLSKIVSEVIPEDIKSRATEGTYSRAVADRLDNADFYEAVGRLAYDSHCKQSDGGAPPDESSVPFTVETVEQIKLSMARISVLEVDGLKTVLMFKNKKVDGSEKDKKSYVDKKEDDVRSCTVYIDTCACGSVELQEHPTILHSLKIAVTFVLNMALNNALLQSALRNPSQALEHMDDEGIARCDFTASCGQSIFPPPGTFVPTAHHCYLDNNFSEFEKGEYVGFEVYDPELGNEEGAENSSPEEDAVYVYAKVIEEVKDGDSEITPLLAKYRINLGPERGEAVVSATTLYKFVRKTSTALSEYAEDSAPSGQTPNMDQGSVLKEIRKILSDAWRLPDEKDRMRVVKRLLLKWHPDKNKGNEEFCKRVFQTIQHYVDLLKQGVKELPEDEDEVDGVYNSQKGYNSFFEHMFRRGQAYSEHYGSGSGGPHSGGSWGFGSGGGNPQPTEGRRWFRQAEADLFAALDALQNCNGGLNWICFKCQQASEKALKAILYQRDAENYLLRAHDLRPLARLINDQELEHLARDLEDRLGSHMRMRYPDVLAYPNIPADVYTTNHAEFACDVTDKLLRRVQCLMH